ncbi:hypothetical protein ABPG72_004543 [Tetrahymena utriculariae]
MNCFKVPQMQEQSNIQADRISNIQIQIGNFDPQNVNFQMNADLYFDDQHLENISEEIKLSIQQDEQLYNNKVVLKLDLIHSCQKEEVKEILLKLIELSKLNNKISLFSLLSVHISIYESSTENSLFLVTNFVDDIHIIIQDIRKIFCNAKSKSEDSFLKFQLQLSNKLQDCQNFEDNSSMYHMMQSSSVSLQMKRDCKTNNQLMNILGLGQEEGLKLVFSKIKNINLNLKFKSFADVPNKSNFMEWVFSLQKARYDDEEIKLLKQLIKCISDQITFRSIFRESLTTVLIKTSLRGLFNYVQEKINE